MSKLRKSCYWTDAVGGTTRRAGWVYPQRSEARLIAHILVIGYGNPLRGDDGAGLFVARQLSKLSELSAHDNIKILSLHQLTPELADDISKAKLVIFIDASWNQPPGHLSCKMVMPGPSITGITTHHLEPSGLLTFTQGLYGVFPDTVIIITIGGNSFGFVEDLSPSVAAALPKLEKVLVAYLLHMTHKLNKR
ncbi:MAG: hydrogenase maturation protease [Firmicutes bacterium]|nr:hydrogenase maturation protease [Bacillota bacterium]